MTIPFYLLSLLVVLISLSLLAAVVITILNRRSIFEWLDSFETWVRNSHKRVVSQRRWYHILFLIQPTLWLWKQACNWTSSLSDPRLKHSFRLLLVSAFLGLMWSLPRFLGLVTIFLLRLVGSYFGVYFLWSAHGLLTPELVILTSSAMVGAAAFFLNQSFFQPRLDRFEKWAIKKHQTVIEAPRRFRISLLVQPFLWAWRKIFEGTKYVQPVKWKNALSASVLVYVTARLFLFTFSWLMAIVYVSINVAIIVFALALIIAVLLAILRGDDDKDWRSDKVTYPSTSPPSTKASVSLNPGQRIEPDTGKIQENSLFGYQDTTQRVNQQTGELEEQGLFGYYGTGMRYNLKTGETEEQTMLGWVSTGKRVNKETGIIQEDTAFGWLDTEYRIDQSTGKYQRRGLLGWEDA